MKKSVLALALVLLLALSACGSNGGDEPSTTSTAPEVTEPTAPPASEEPEGAAYEVSYTNAKVWTNSIGTTSVSYTHLDVYKRQPPCMTLHRGSLFQG